MRDGARLVHLLIGGKELGSTSTIANQELSIDQFMSGHFIEPQESIQLDGIGRPIRQESNPDRRIDQNHQATLRLVAGLSRRLGTSRA